MIPVFSMIRPLAAKAGLTLSKHLPTILTAVGSAGLVTSAVMACKKTSYVEGILDKMNDNLKVADDAHNGLVPLKDAFTEEQYRADVRNFKIQGAIELAKLYAVPVGLGLASLACIFSGHYILMARLASMTAAYTGVAASYQEYRKRIVDKFGSEVDNDILHNVKHEMSVIDTIKNPDGTETQVLDSKPVAQDPEGLNPYRAYFGPETCSWYHKDDYRMNHFMLMRVQDEANEILHSRGYIFLNEVRRKCGLEDSMEGQLIGWTMWGDGDHMVDIGLCRDEKAVDFTMGIEEGLWLNFNCDAEPVYTQLSKASTWRFRLNGDVG